MRIILDRFAEDTRMISLPRCIHSDTGIRRRDKRISVGYQHGSSTSLHAEGSKWMAPADNNIIEGRLSLMDSSMMLRRLFAALTDQCLSCWRGSREPAPSFHYDESAARGRHHIPLQEVAFPPSEGIALQHRHGDSSLSHTAVASARQDGLRQWHPCAPLATLPSSHCFATVVYDSKTDDPIDAADTFSRFQPAPNDKTLAACPENILHQAMASSDGKGKSPLHVQIRQDLTLPQGPESSQQPTVAPSGRAIIPETPPAQGHPGSQHGDARVGNCGGRIGTAQMGCQMDIQDVAPLSWGEGAVVAEEPSDGALPCGRREATVASKRLAGNITTLYDDGRAAPSREARATVPAASKHHRRKRARRSISNRGVMSFPDAVAFGEGLLRQGLLCRVDSEGRRDGSWVMDTSIYALLQCLSEAAPHTYRCEEYDVGLLHLDCCPRQFLNCSDLTGTPTRNQVMVVAHINAKAQHGLHYSLLILNARHWVAHVFDTLTPWPEESAGFLVSSAFPCMEGASRLRVHNHTGKLRQSGATCGAWTAWLACAYAFNFGGCRHDEDDWLDIGPLQDDAPGFWRSVTY